MKNIITIVFCIIILRGINGQSTMLSLSEARNTAIKNSLNVKAIEKKLDRDNKAFKSSISIDNPVVRYESPTGTFYTVGVEQTLSLPIVYKNQKNLSKAQLALTQHDVIIAKEEVKYLASTLYLNAQTAAALTTVAKAKSEVVNSIYNNSIRLYEAGDIDFLQVQKTKIEKNDAEMGLLNATIDRNAAHIDLAAYLREKEETMNLDSLHLYDELLLEQKNGASIFAVRNSLSEDIAKQEIKISKSSYLPAITLGYMNQGEKDSQLKYRFNLGTSIPIWIKQNKAKGATALANYEAVRAENEVQNQEREIRILSLENKIKTSRQKIDFIKNNGINNLKELEVISKRMYDVGQVSLLNYLNDVIRSFDMQKSAIEAIKEYNSAIIEYEYLNAK
jgi:outer membrane protein, heavy metal efflux system